MFAKKMNRMKAAFLATAIALTLSGSAAYAMPEGGSVASGTVTGLTNGTVASGGTLTATSDAIINWNSFNIASGETLNLNTTDHALLNRVTGTGISTLAGILNQTGTNTAILVNPNGIVVSGTGVINAGNMILTTLALSDSQFLNGNTATFTQSGSTPALLSVENGAKLNVEELLILAGGKVNVADGVTFSTKSSGDDVMIENLAAKSFTFQKENETQDVMGSTTTTTDNAMAFHGTFDNTSSSENTNFHIDGGTVNLDGATLKLNNASELYSTAGQQQDSETVPGTATSANVLSGNNLTVSGGKIIGIFGGQTTLTNSSITSNASESNITVASGTTASMTGNEDYDGLGQLATHTADASNVTTLINTTIQNKDGEIHVDGGRTIVDNSKLTSDDTIVVAAVTNEVSDGNDITKNVANGNNVTLKNGTAITTKDAYVYGYSVEMSPTVTISTTKDNMLADHTYNGSTNSTATTIADSTTTGYATAANVDTTISNSGSTTNDSGNTNTSSGSTTNNASAVKTSDEIQTEATTVQSNLLTDATTQATQAASDLMGTSMAATTEPEATESNIQVDGNAQEGADIHALEHGTDSIIASTVTAALEQGNEQFESFIQRNIEYGYHSMEDALTADTPAERMEQASALVSRIDSDKNMDEGAKLAQAYGMIQAVQDNGKMSAQEKATIRNMIATSFRSLSKDVRVYLSTVAASAAQRNL
ncbi:MAG: filamentous hemagglutinin N-terminal domain-containing protein [Selenomonas sp.]|uniref:two-partner secretion domain-containing protein n=1 Tax=Selenomonas sp. TaxID=2053611 RepID=UPI0025CD1882|nr:filamentous hemagglutinin N-terminal domain-containing protein [Selenomonas sp.]MCI6232330.1 filamentous hemagglutinin N-terminal domain-containing protein [Selenomonas sp.]